MNPVVSGALIAAIASVIGAFSSILGIIATLYWNSRNEQRKLQFQADEERKKRAGDSRSNLTKSYSKRPSAPISLPASWGESFP